MRAPSRLTGLLLREESVSVVFCLSKNKLQSEAVFFFADEMRATNLVQGNENSVCNLLKRGNDSLILLPIERNGLQRSKQTRLNELSFPIFFVRPRRLLIPETLPGNVTAMRRTGPS